MACPYCGQEIASGSGRCPACGAPVPAEDRPRPQASPGPGGARVGPGRKLLRVGLVVLVVVVAVVGLVVMTLDELAAPEEAEPTVVRGPAAAPTLPIRPMAPLEGPPAEGMRVLAPFGTQGYYFVGRIRAVRGDGQVHVLFLDGDQGVVASTALRQEDLGPGSLVHARPGASRSWYAGQVHEREADRVNVHFDDGDVAWVPLTQVRHAPPPTGP